MPGHEISIDEELVKLKGCSSYKIDVEFSIQPVEGCQRRPPAKFEGQKKTAKPLWGLFLVLIAQWFDVTCAKLLERADLLSLSNALISFIMCLFSSRLSCFCWHPGHYGSLLCSRLH